MSLNVHQVSFSCVQGAALFNVPKNENSLFTFMPFQMSMAFICLTQTEIFKEIIHFYESM